MQRIPLFACLSSRLSSTSTYADMIKHYACIAVSLTTLVTTAQPVTSGTEHWVTFMENLDLQFNTPPYFELVISCEEDATGEIVVPATGFAVPFTVAGMQDTVITLPENIYYGEGDEAIFDFGLKVVSDQPVNVYAYHHRLYFSEASMILPVERLGTDYTVLAHEDDLYGHPSEFVVLATSDSTEVTITPSVLTQGFRPPGVPFIVWLAEGQTFQLKASGDLSGSRITVPDPGKPVAVFAGAQQAAINCDMGADDHLYQQIEPRSAWGSAYDIVPFKGRGGDQVHIISGSNGTTVNITGQPSFTLDSAQVVDVTISAPSHITSSAPVCVGQFNDSQGCNPATGDPCYLFCQPSERADQRAIWSALTGEGTPEHFVNVVALGDAVPPLVFLDGLNVSGLLDPMVGASEVYTAQFSIDAGRHELYCPTGCLGSAYGFGDYNSYSFHLGYGPSAPNTAVQEHGTSTGMAVIVLRSEDELTARALGLDMWLQLKVFDATGRLVVESGQPDRAGIRLHAGPYFIQATDRSGQPRVRRLLVR